MAEGYKVYGAPGSPYSIKMRAVLRYRRLPHQWVVLGPGGRAEIEAPGPPVIPVVEYPDGSRHTDSTPIIYDLERRLPGERSLLPDDPALSFVAHLLEDMADEWGTKIMFHYRWFRPPDQEACSRWLVFDAMRGAGLDMITASAAMIRDRQISRMPLVGCTPANQTLIEESLARVLRLLEAHVTEQPYLFGTRPSIADFGWYAQLYQAASDPTAGELVRTTAPFTYRWLQLMDDCSGVEGEWNADHAVLPAAVEGLLEMAGDTYLPFLVANAEALERGEETFQLSILGHDYEQGTFKYQKKCLGWLRDEMAGIDGEPLERLRAWLHTAGCWDALGACA